MKFYRFITIFLIMSLLVACSSPRGTSTTASHEAVTTNPELSSSPNPESSSADQPSASVSRRPKLSTEPISQSPDLFIDAIVLDVTDNPAGCTSTDLLPGHRYRISIVVTADELGSQENMVESKIASNVFFVVHLPRFIPARDLGASYYDGAELELSVATDAAYTTAANDPTKANVRRQVLNLYGTERELLIQPLACSAVEWYGLVRQDTCDWIANPRLDASDPFLLTHQVGDLSSGQSRTFSFDFWVLDAADYQATCEEAPFEIQLLGAYPASASQPGPTVTAMKRAIRQGNPIFESPRSDEDYYLTFALPFPSYLRAYLDASEIGCLSTEQFLTIDAESRQIRFSHKLSANDVLVGYTEFSMELPEGFPSFARDQFLKITPSYWSTAQVDYPLATFSADTGLKSAYQPYPGEIITDCQVDGVDSNDRVRRERMVQSRPSLHFQLGENDVYQSGVLYLTYRIAPSATAHAPSP